jgi:type I restriction enzyme S subunit
LPGIEEQRAIVEVLKSLDDKIAANDRQLVRLADLIAAEFTRALDTGSSKVLLEEVAEFHNRLRVPLSAREREQRSGSVPYYGAAGRLDFIDQALFDKPLVLVGEDGTVVRQDGRPVVQYIWGPAWVNNHAHVLTGRSISTETLKVTLERANVTHLVTGAVQPKISMGNLKSLVLEIPTEIARLEARAQAGAALVRALSDENSALIHTREKLLPLLMSGEMHVRGIERAVAEVV